MIGAIIIVGCAAFLAALFFSGPTISKKKTAVGWREDFSVLPVSGRSALPKGWVLQRKPGTRSAVFSVAKDAGSGGSFLRMESDKASAALITRPYGVDLKKTPLVRWRWRATTLPNGADGRQRAKDDQAIGIYIGAGNALNNKSVSYRWDTETPKGSEGNCAYGLGSTRVKWYTLRNKEDLGGGLWFTEERDVARDFMSAWGFCPETVYVSVSCNSQYTRSAASADLAWIEFAGNAQ